MENFVHEKYSNMVDLIEGFLEQNKDLRQKEFAAKAFKELDKKYIVNAVLKKFAGREINYKDILKKNWKELNFQDENNKL